MNPEKLLCPYRGCVGTLTSLGTESTTIGYPGLDRNTFVERLLCSECKKTVKRAWQWEPDEETLHD